MSAGKQKMSQNTNKQEALVAGVHKVVELGEKLSHCKGSCDLYKQAVEMLRDEFDIERCGIFLDEGERGVGTFGTDIKGKTIDERDQVLSGQLEWGRFKDILRKDNPRWIVRDSDHFFPADKHRNIRPGWVACTPISYKGKPPVALLFNDSAIENADIDPVKQDIIAVFCTQLAEILEQRQAEESLQRSELSYRAIFEATGTAMLMLEQDMTISLVNREFECMSGHNRNEVIGQLWTTYIHPYDLPGVMAHYQRRLTQPDETPNHYEFRAFDKGNNVLFLHSRIHQVPGTNRHIVSLLDMTAREQAERALMESEERFRSLFQRSPDAIFVEDYAGNILDVNPRACELHGLSRKQLIGANVLDLVPQESRPLVQAEFPKWIAGNLSHYEGFSIRNDGTKTPVEINASNIEYLGQPALLFHVHDISHRKEAEHREVELQTQLSRAKRMESLGLLAGRVAHDLNNILGPMVAYPEMIRQELPPDSPIQDDIREIEEASKRATTIIQNLLNLSRRGVRRSECTSLKEVINSYFASAGFKALQSEHNTVVVDSGEHDDSLFVEGVSSHLFQVLMNLVINAFEAMPHGGHIRISSRRENVTQTIMGYQQIPPGNYCVLCVADDGHGIDKNDLEMVFEPFFTKKAMGGSGTGLGLSVVYGIVQDMRGCIDVISNQGEGTEFRLYFPSTKNVQKDAPTCGEELGGSETILIVDDEAKQRKLANRLLTSLGYKVLVAENGRKAITILQDLSVDLVLLDMIMEDGFDGLDTYQAICKIVPGQPCVIASGFSENARVEKARQLGAGAFIAKPYTRDNLAKAVRKELG